MSAPIDCPICMDCIESTSKNCVTTECGHCFHTNCLMKSVAHNGFGCPYCRTAMAEQPEEDDDDDSFWADEDEDDEQVFDDYALRGFRFFFNNLNGQPHDEDDIAEEDQDDETISDNEEQVNNNNIPSTEIVSQKLREQGVTFEQLVKMICALDHHGYDNHEEEAEEFEEKLHGMVERIVANYTPEPAAVAKPSVDLEAQPKTTNEVRLFEE